MKTVCMHLRIFLCLLSALVLLGILTVTPCPRGQKFSLFGRAYAVDTARAGELIDGLRGLLCRCCKKG